MRDKLVMLLVLWVAVAETASAKAPARRVLAAEVLRARTVAVLVDPGAGMALRDPDADQMAQKDVEAALMNWGRFQMVPRSEIADLVIVLRRGHRSLVTETIVDRRQHAHAGVVNPTQDGEGAGAQHGPAPGTGSWKGQGPGEASATPLETEIPRSGDSFAVYRGRVKNPLHGAPVWRSTADDGLKPHTVPAVAEFRKAVEEAENGAAAARKKP